jgi:FAD-dependent urate hydroxylase
MGISPLVVIGGGVAGPAAAMALRRAGIEPVIYEAYPHTADDAGVFLTVATNGIDALRTIGAPRGPEGHPDRSVPKLPRWHSDRMVVLGDAAHAPMPTSGQGASWSIEDGVVLARCPRDLPDPRQALARFETLRRPRVEGIIKVANSINNNKAPGPVGQVIRDAFMPLVMKLTATSTF